MGVLVAGLAAVVGVASASASVAPSFSATNVATCHGSSTVTVTVKAQNPPPVQQAADIVLLVDGSGSIGSTTFDDQVRPSLDNFIDYANPSPSGNHIGIVKFATGAFNVTPSYGASTGALLSSGTTLKGDVAAMPYNGGYTYTLTGLQAAEAMLNGPGSRPGVPKVIIVETDGVWDPYNTQNPASYAYHLVHTDGVNIFVVGVGTQVNPNDLLAIAGGVQTNVFPITDYSTLESTLDSALLEAIPAATGLSYEVTPASGWTITGASASDGAATVSGGDLSWSLGSINSADGTSVTISYTEQHTGSVGGSAVPLASSATLAYTDAEGTAQSVDYKDQTVSVSGCDTIPPIVSDVAASPNPVGVNTASTLTAKVDDSTTGNSNIAGADYRIDGGAWTPMSASDGTFDSPTEQVTVPLPSALESTAGVHTLCVRGTDAAGNTSDGSSCTQFVVYDPSAGFVTGGGWINSPAGACKNTSVCTDTTGKVTFNFVSRYKKGANAPGGSTGFVFHAGDLHFAGTGYNWLVVTQAGTVAQFEGDGTINGIGGYHFTIWATDGSPDTFRIRITDSGGNTVYDNGSAQPIDGGSIVVHS